jgi:adenylate cyclase
MARIEVAFGKRPDDAQILSWGALTMTYLGENARAEEWAKRSIAVSPDEYIVRYNAAMVYAAVGRPDTALEYLEFVFLHVPRARRWVLGWINHDSPLDSLRDRPDFRDFMKRLEADVAEHP